MSFCAHRTRHFPEAPRTLLGSGTDCEGVRSFLEQVREWHGLTRQWLDSPEANEPLSAELVRLLSLSMSAKPAQQISVFPYWIVPFPIDFESPLYGASVPCDLMRQRGKDVMLWRAYIVDFLSDVWNTAGEPLFELRECSYAIDCIFMPSPVPGYRFCPDCLDRFPVPDTNGSFKAHYAACPVRGALAVMERPKSLL